MLNVCFTWVHGPKVGFPVPQGKVFMDSLSSSDSINQLIVIYGNHNGEPSEKKGISDAKAKDRIHKLKSNVLSLLALGAACRMYIVWISSF